jgi:hypothetical protein
MSKCFRASVLATVIGASLSGCYAPNNGGGVFSMTGGPCTYYSTETMQKSVTMVDVRTNEMLFSIDLPPGKQLTMVFEEGAGDDPVYRPDLMRYEVFELGTTGGKLHSELTVPNAASRRVDVSVRQQGNYAGPRPRRALRADETANQPDWWTPRGGPMPNERRFNLYDN